MEFFNLMRLTIPKYAIFFKKVTKKMPQLRKFFEPFFIRTFFIRNFERGDRFLAYFVRLNREISNEVSPCN